MIKVITHALFKNSTKISCYRNFSRRNPPRAPSLAEVFYLMLLNKLIFRRDSATSVIFGGKINLP